MNLKLLVDPPTEHAVAKLPVAVEKLVIFGRPLEASYEGCHDTDDKGASEVTFTPRTRYLYVFSI
jgi:hypothetical protein